MVIREIMQTLSGVYEITTATGSAFFLRTHYLRVVAEDSIFAGAELTEEEALDLLNAGSVYGAEVTAMTYLSRAEHCRHQLEQKLLKKNHDRNAVSAALDYLEEKGLLDDMRFAGAWLRTRSIDHHEGRNRLAAELSARGVRRDSCQRTIKEFFDENDEAEICRKAFSKLMGTGKTEEKIRLSLVQKGFPLKIINEVIKSDRKN